jgi:hypothetical protein
MEQFAVGDSSHGKDAARALLLDCNNKYTKHSILCTLVYERIADSTKEKDSLASVTN